MAKAVVRAKVARWSGRRRAAAVDSLAVEEPCEIRLNGEAVAVVMRTPGHDRELAAGFLFTEGIVGPGEIGAIAHCLRGAGRAGNVVDVRLRPGARPRRAWQRRFFAGSSCGICGKATIESIRLRAAPLPPGPAVRRRLLPALARRLRRAQEIFAATGGLHAAALFDAAGKLVVLREDVGRHNAVDKTIGHCLLNGGAPLDRHLLLVSGRTSFEIVQKALMARIPIVAGVSAASSLAVELARHSNMTLVGFLRGQRMNVYAGEERLA